MNTNEIARIAALVGEPARTAMLLELMDGRALTANELAIAGNVLPQTASKHLSQLVEGGLLSIEQSGRGRYHRLASPDVARVLEGIMQIASRSPDQPPRKFTPGPRDADMRRARTCYDHIAGRLGVAIAARLLEGGAITFDGDSGAVTPRARQVLAPLGISLGESTHVQRPVYCRPCLDCSERRHHVAGRLGTLICDHCLSHDWLRRRHNSRALDITSKGAQQLSDWLGAERWHGVS